MNRLFLQRISLPLLIALLSACGNGNGGISISGDSQDPDPVVVDYPIFYVKRILPTDDDDILQEIDERQPYRIFQGAALYKRDRASTSAAETNITARIHGNENYDVKDLSVSFDGSKILFAMHAPEDDPDDPDFTWNIWEYNNETDSLRRIITSDIFAEEGDDISPQYLPDGRIIFSSTRQRKTKTVLTNEGKTPHASVEENLQNGRRIEAAVLHVMNEDGSDIQQVSFNHSHDLYPTITSNGKVVFSRWENYGSDGMTLYRMNPDGTSLEVLYGHHSHNNDPFEAVQFIRPMAMPNDRILAQTRPFESIRLGGNYAIIDVNNYIDYSQGTAANNAATGPAEQTYTDLDIQIERDTSTDPDTITISPGGRISAIFPLWDGTNRALMSWSQCRLEEGGLIVPCTDDRLNGASPVEADPLYGIWMYDLDKNSQVPVVLPEEGVVYSEIVVAQDRALANFIYDIEDVNAGDPDFDDLVAQNLAVIHIRSVYDFDGTNLFNNNAASPVDISLVSDPTVVAADQRPAQFIRIVKGVPIPHRDIKNFNVGNAFGPSGEQMKEIVGYVPVEPDGSAKFYVPANIPIALSVLDGNARRITARHRNWIQLRPGENLTCNGCHTRNSTAPHGRPGAQFDSIYDGAATSGVPFPNTDPALVATMGQTMAETWETHNDIRTPSVDVTFTDDWTDPGGSPSASYSFLYDDLTTTTPPNSICTSGWNAYCRIIINYPDHIQPLWELDRSGVNGTDPFDDTCTTCHSNRDAMAQVRVPAGQLDLHGGTPPGVPNPVNAYDDLVRTSDAQELDMGALVPLQVQDTDGMGNPLFLTDGNGDLVLDGMGNPIPVMVTVTIASRLNTGGANAARSVDFFNKFEDPADTVHFGLLTPAELRLISEWIDIGGQYYNNPFDAP